MRERLREVTEMPRPQAELLTVRLGWLAYGASSWSAQVAALGSAIAVGMFLEDPSTAKL